MKKQKGVINQTLKTFKLDNDLLEFWDESKRKNRNRLVNNLIREEKLKRSENEKCRQK